MTTLPEVPTPLPPSQPRFNPDGKPTTAYVAFERKLDVFLRAIKAAIEAI